MSLIVQKYGGSSLANSDLIRNVAKRISNASEGDNQVVATVSAMGDSTDNLMDIAAQITNSPNPRELDVLLSTGELQSCALVCMALQELGKNAVSLSGGQAGIITDSRFGNAKICGNIILIRRHSYSGNFRFTGKFATSRTCSSSNSESK